MKTLWILVRRNTKLFFKDKGMFFTSLITPMILLVLYATFLAKVYRDSFTASLPSFLEVEASLIDGLVACQLFSSLLAVTCITVAFCSNFLMVQDKITGGRDDMLVSPVSRTLPAFAYYISTVFATLIVCLTATAVCLVYVAIVGWYLSFTDILLILCDVLLLVLFGTALSSLIHHFLTTQGQISAVGAIVSAGYGFICGAYMPISQFSEGLQKVISFFPGTYGTSLLRNHTMRGVFGECADLGFPTEVIEAMRDTVDCNIYFFGDKVPIGAMYAVLGTTVAVLMAAYLVICLKRKRV